MQLSHEAITSFQKLYYRKRGVMLSTDEAQVKALSELKRFSVIYKPIPITDLELLNKLNANSNKNYCKMTTDSVSTKI